jgi:hypothetical protein
MKQMSGHSGSWTQGILARYGHQLYSDNPLARGRPGLIESEKGKLIELCQKSQTEK